MDILPVKICTIFDVVFSDSAHKIIISLGATDFSQKVDVIELVVLLKNCQ